MVPFTIKSKDDLGLGTIPLKTSQLEITIKLEIDNPTES